MTRTLLVLAGGLMALFSHGCVRRTLTIRTVPEGATVWINDEEVGKSAVTVDFTWYGDYDIVCRKPGYQALSTHHRLRPPWYQIPPFDFFAEVLTPWTYQDHHAVDLQLEPEQLPTRAELIDRATQLRERALFSEE